MNTPSHFLLHLGIKKYFWNKFFISKSFIFWSIAPDIWLYLCVFFYSIYWHYYLWNDMSLVFNTMFEQFYFTNTIWIFAYNFLHSLFLLIIFLFISWWIKNYYNQRIWIICIWFIVWCLLHSLIDISMHHNDGPRIFYPLSQYTFHSPISYWDPRYYWNIVWKIELLWDLFLLLYLIYSPIKHKIKWIIQ